MTDYNVTVDGVGTIGKVAEDSESLARLAALSKFSSEGTRVPGSLDPKIYEDDEFVVVPD